MRVLVTGAAGLVGRSVVRAARAARFEVRAVDVDTAGLRALDGDGVEASTVDLCQVGALAGLLSRVDAVIHCAGRFDFAASREALDTANRIAVERVVDAALEARVESFVHVSSAGVYGLPAHTPILEDGPKRPKNAYEETMWEGERAVLRAWRERGLPARVLRPSLIYGPGGKTGVASLAAGIALARSLGAPEVLFVEEAPRMHHVHVDDVARAALLLIERSDAIGRAFNCGDEAPVSWSRLGAAICDRLGLGRRSVPASMLKLLLALPERLRERLNDRIARRWALLCDQGLASDAIRPRLDRDLIGYLAGDHVYELRALGELGFRARHPRILDELPGLLRWYEQQRWLPGEGA